MPSKFVDRTNVRYGRLLVVRRGPPAPSGASWECVCDCGRSVVVTASNLAAGQSQCRECAKQNSAEDLSGQRFGRLVVSDRFVLEAGKRRLWECSCDCGRMHYARSQHLKSGQVQSCGCLVSERASDANTTHGKSGHPAYAAWENMNQRCNNPKHPNYDRYGGRGITICERWADSSAFLEDMLPTWQAGLTLDRRDPDGNYEPNNCRWITQREQVNNRSDTILIDWDGEKLTIADLAARFGLRPNTIRYRWRHGKRGEDLVAPP